MRRIILIGIAVLLMGIIAAWGLEIWKKPAVVFNLPPAESSSSSLPVASSSSSAVSAALPPSVQIRVPFSTQAPFAVWDAMHEETCEEMALIMVQRFWTQGTLTPQEAEDELQRLVSWMTGQHYPVDVTMAQLAKTAEEYYHLRATIDTDTSAENIRHWLAKGYPVIIPAAGRELGNPYFSGAGPWYHALVINGYDGNSFITNDPGTRRGQDYRYDSGTLLSAIHDWTGVKEQIGQGRKVLLIVQKEG